MHRGDFLFFSKVAKLCILLDYELAGKEYCIKCKPCAKVRWVIIVKSTRTQFAAFQ